MARLKAKLQTHSGTNLSSSNYESDDDYNDASSDEAEERLSDAQYEAEDEGNDMQNGDKSGMADVVARILSKDTSKSNRVLLAKGKTNKEILSDISKRKRQRQEADDPELETDISKHETSKKEYWIKEEKRKLWESMGRRIPSVLENPREAKLRKLATQGMVQLFRSVNEHQKVMKEKLSSAGDSEIKKDRVMAEFSKGKFLDLLKGKTRSEKPSIHEKDAGAKWKILQDDYMMGASMKDWDKDDSSGDNDDEQDQSMDASVLSDDD
ncbi:Rrp15-like protein [Plakobranchus ocellatus]|uniref:RRP15-like protein n=1 Tax=Plakobranchus ocellatus TaxID=259542 RepID=A0AAV4B0R9_9GAST|nr:Rrp15-like protein [Plakobranchus ocellatus]